MNKTKTLQERIENLIRKELEDKLKVPSFVMINLTFGDFSKAVKRFMANGNDSDNYSTNMDNITKGSNEVGVALKEIVLERLYPAYYNERIQEILKILNP